MQKKNAKSPRNKVAAVPHKVVQRPTWQIDASFIRRRRMALGLTMIVSAKRSGIGRRQSWYAFESGERKTTSVATLLAIARTLRCKVNDLILQD